MFHQYIQVAFILLSFMKIILVCIIPWEKNAFKWNFCTRAGSFYPKTHISPLLVNNRKTFFSPYLLDFGLQRYKVSLRSVFKKCLFFFEEKIRLGYILSQRECWRVKLEVEHMDSYNKRKSSFMFIKNFIFIKFQNV